MAVFEPRSYTARTRVFQDGFARAFAAADRVIVAAAHLPGKVPEGQRLSRGRSSSAGIRREGGEAAFRARPWTGSCAALAASLRPGDRVAILSNGGFGGIHDKLLARPRSGAALAAKTPPQSPKRSGTGELSML